MSKTLLLELRDDIEKGNSTLITCTLAQNLQSGRPRRRVHHLVNGKVSHLGSKAGAQQSVMLFRTALTLDTFTSAIIDEQCTYFPFVIIADGYRVFDFLFHEECPDLLGLVKIKPIHDLCLFNVFHASFTVIL